MFAVGMLGSYLTQGVYAVAGPFQPFGGAVDIIVVQQEDGTFKSSPWYVKFGDFQGVLKRREKIVDIAVNDVPADFHMFLDDKGEAYFEKEVESDEATVSALPSVSSLSWDNTAGDGETKGLDSSKTTTVEVRSHVHEASCARSRLEASENGSSQISELVDDRISLYMKSVTEEERLEMQESSSRVHGDGLNPGVRDDRILSDSNTLAALELPEAFNTDSGMEAAHTDDGSINMDLAYTGNSHNVTVEERIDLRNAQNTALKLIATVRSNDGDNSSTLVKEERISTSSSTVTVEEGLDLQDVAYIGAEVEVPGKCNDESKSDLREDRILVGLETAEGTSETPSADSGLEAADTCNEGPNDAGSGDDIILSGFKPVTVKEKREMHTYSSIDNPNDSLADEIRTEQVDNDSAVWVSDAMVNQDTSDVVIAISESSTFLLDEKAGDMGSGNECLEKEVKYKMEEGIAIAATQAAVTAVSSPSRWSLWPFLFKRSRVGKDSLSASTVSNQALLAAANVAIESPFTEELLQKNGYYKWPQKAKVRTYVPPSAQLASLKLKDGPNKVTFTFSRVLGKTEVDARIYLWKWNTRIVISDVDGTITKSDVLGQVMPLVGRDWSQYGVTRLFSAIKDNGFEVLFLSARAISQAYLTRRFLLNLKQDGEALPEGPVFISPDGLIPSLYREVIRRAPHEFKIACLEGIRELFPKDVNPFYAGFGNRETDEISYLKVGIPKGKIFIINPKGEVVVNHRVDCKSYTSLHGLVDDMFPPISSHEQEDFNSWNYWKMPLPDIDDELSVKGSKSTKKGSSSKK